MKMKIMRKLIIVAMVIIGALHCICMGGLIVKTTFQILEYDKKISAINQDVSMCQPGYGWTEERVEKYNALINERRETLYESENPIVRWYSTQENWIQFPVFLISLLLIIGPFIPLFLRNEKKQIPQKKPRIVEEKNIERPRAFNPPTL